MKKFIIVLIIALSLCFVGTASILLAAGESKVKCPCGNCTMLAIDCGCSAALKALKETKQM